MTRLDPRSRLDFGRPTALVRNRSLSLRFDVRSILVCTPLILAALTVAIVSLATGDYDVTVQQVLQAFTGDAPWAGPNHRHGVAAPPAFFRHLCSARPWE